MPEIEAIIFRRLNSNSELRAEVKGNIFPEYREDRIPALCIDMTILDSEEGYEGTGLVQYELTISVFAQDYPTAAEIGGLVVNDLHRASWVDGSYVIDGAYYKDRDGGVKPVVNARDDAGAIDLRFDVVVKMT